MTNQHSSVKTRVEDYSFLTDFPRNNFGNLSLTGKLKNKIKRNPMRSMAALITTIVLLTVAITCAAVFTNKENAIETSTTMTSTAMASFFLTTEVPMRDGFKLKVDYYAGANNTSLPVILELTPYGRERQGVNYRSEAPYWYSHGYIFVIADCRGTGDSEGEMMFFAKEGQDGYDLVEWIARQPWSNGHIAMRGSSYSGTNQWFVAKEQPPHLSCITPSATIGRPMEDIPFINGAFAVNWAIDWIGQQANIPKLPPVGPAHPNASSWLSHRPLRTLDVFATGRELPLYRSFIDHPTYDDFWRAIDFTAEDFAKINIPALAFTGWFDGTMYGTIWRFQQARLHSPRRADHFLVVGPYTHGNAPDGGYDFMTGEPMLSVGDLPVPLNALLPGLNMTLEFFNWCLKDQSRPNWPLAKIFITGSDRWITDKDFPPVETHEQSLFLNEGGQLQWESVTVNASDQYVYDPYNSLIVSDFRKPLGLPVDINPLLNHAGMLIYTTSTLTQSLTVLGEVRLELKISSSAIDTDFVFQLMDVTPDGRSIKLGSKMASQLRTRYRNGYTQEVLMAPHQIYLIRLDLHEIGHTFLPGHRIRIAVTSSFYPWISVNPNTGAPIANDTESPIIANQTIYYDSVEPSRLVLPVIN